MPDGLEESRREEAKRRLVYDFGLTKTPELCVLERIVNGESNPQIATVLNPYGQYSENYVKRIVRNICRKMDVKNRTAAAVKAVLYGLTPDKN